MDMQNMKRILFLTASLLGTAALAEGPSRFDCLIEPNMVVDINSSVQGKISTILVQRSDMVEEGQLLVELLGCIHLSPPLTLCSKGDTYSA